MNVYVVRHAETESALPTEFCQTNRMEDAVQIAELAFQEVGGIWTVSNRIMHGAIVTDYDTVYVVSAQ